MLYYKKLYCCSNFFALTVTISYFSANLKLKTEILIYISTESSIKTIHILETMQKVCTLY